MYVVDKQKRTSALIKLINDENWQQLLVFIRTKHGANNLVKKLLASKISAAAIHGNKSQSARESALKNFKEYNLQVLVATDIASRGIDIPQLPQVLNFDLPDVPEDYVHRIGRTGRAGEDGNAVSLVCADQITQLVAIEKLIKLKLERKEIYGFEASHNVPESDNYSEKSSDSNKNTYDKTKNNIHSNGQKRNNNQNRSKKTWAPRDSRNSSSKQTTKRRWQPKKNNNT
jgi:ATP-dependent RNA helicase RhlE